MTQTIAYMTLKAQHQGPLSELEASKESVCAAYKASGNHDALETAVKAIAALEKVGARLCA